MKNILMSVLFSLLIIVSCSAGKTTDSVLVKGKYNFKMTDSSGKEMLTGVFVKTFNTDNSISGAYGI